MRQFRLPALGESVREATVTRWFKTVGDRVEVGELLLEVSTDKVDMELKSDISGTVAELLVAVDQTVPVGSVLLVFEPVEPVEVVLGASAERPITFRVRALLRHHQLSPAQVFGTGHRGRITPADVLAVAQTSVNQTTAGGLHKAVSSVLPSVSSNHGSVQLMTTEIEVPSRLTQIKIKSGQQAWIALMPELARAVCLALITNSTIAARVAQGQIIQSAVPVVSVQNFSGYWTKFRADDFVAGFGLSGNSDDHFSTTPGLAESSFQIITSLAGVFVATAPIPLASTAILHSSFPVQRVTSKGGGIAVVWLVVLSLTYDVSFVSAQDAARFLTSVAAELN